jgi:hypothetical protein
MTPSRLLAFTAVLCSTAGCTTTRFSVIGIHRAAFDLECEEAKIKVTDLGGETDITGDPLPGFEVGATGCGRKATYALVSHELWQLKGHVDSTTAAPSPAQP